MASTFSLTLDTTAPTITSAVIAGGAAYATAQTTTLDSVVNGADVSQMKVWGAGLDTTFDANQQATEGASAWVAYSASKAIKLAAGDGSKSVSVRVRDDAGNESAVTTDAITVDTTIPVPSISIAASPTKISKVAGFDTSTFSFQSDTPIQAWKVKVVPATNSLHTAGTTIPTTAGSSGVTGGTADSGVQALAATTNQSVSVKGTDLETASAGDGTKIVKVFVQDMAGNWSAA